MQNATCKIPDCARRVRSRGVCNTHYLRILRHGSADDRREDFWVRFWRQVDKTESCWVWTGATSGGYGRFQIKRAVTGSVHRMAYEHLVGPIPEGMVIDHRCHNEDLTCPGGECRHRRCVNPSHLDTATTGGNVVLSTLTVTGINARKTHCIHGHEFTSENTYVDKRGSRQCRECQRLRRLNGARDTQKREWHP